MEQRPTVVAVLHCDDYGPSDNGLLPARCPHCGADGRYIYRCVMSSGEVKGMMKGCLGTFKKDPIAAQCERALEKESHKRASKWDMRIIIALRSIEKLGMENLRNTCIQVAAEKRQWMKKKGWL